MTVTADDRLSRDVLVERRVPVSVQSIWQHIRAFDISWHPAVTACHLERDSAGKLIRTFEVTGRSTCYREQRSYFSDTEHSLSYLMLEGIDGLRRYDANVTVQSGNEGECRVIWRASVVLRHGDVDAVAERTSATFQTAIDALTKLALDAPAAKLVSRPKSNTVRQSLETLRLKTSPRLGLSISPAGLEQADQVCIFLHGIGGNRTNWDSQVAAIAETVPCIAMDLRGYGESDLGIWQTQVEDYCADILEVMSAFGAKRLILCGLSYGAWIASTFAVAYGEMLDGLVLSGGATGMAGAAPERLASFKRAREEPLDAGLSPAEFAEPVVAQIAGPNIPQQARAALMASMSAVESATYRDALNCFCNPQTFVDFSQLDCPVMVLTGEHDSLATPERLAQVAHDIHMNVRQTSVCPDVRFEVLSGAGHVCNLECPEAYNELLFEFITPLANPDSSVTVANKAGKRQRKSERILDAALHEFSSQSFSGASMESIAARAGVSKPTLYQYFGHKEDLLSAVLARSSEHLLAPFQTTETASLCESLWAFSWHYAAFVLRPDMMSLARLIIAEASHFPDVARIYHEGGPLRALNGIQTFLESQRTLGRVRFSDGKRAAQHLWTLTLSSEREWHLHRPNLRPDIERTTSAIEEGLRVFFVAYATEPQAEIAKLKHMVGPTL